MDCPTFPEFAPAQRAFLARPEREVLYCDGPGRAEALVAAALAGIDHPDYRAYLFAPGLWEAVQHPNSLMGVVRVAGKIGIPGLYVTEDPGAVDAAAKMGSLSIRFGLGWAKSHSFHTGQTPVMKYNRQLMQAIMWDRINIAEVVGVQVISLDQAPQGYGEFDAGVPKKFVIDPHKMFSAA